MLWYMVKHGVLLCLLLGISGDPEFRLKVDDLCEIGIRYEVLGLRHDALNTLRQVAAMEPGVPCATSAIGRLESLQRCHKWSSPFHPAQECSAFGNQHTAACAIAGQPAPQDSVPEFKVEGGVRVMSVSFGVCGTLLRAGPSEPIGTTFTREAPWESLPCLKKEVDEVVVDGCEKNAARDAKVWHTLRLSSAERLWRGEELLSWIEGDDPFVISSLFLKYNGIVDKDLLRPIFVLIVQRHAALNNALLNIDAPPWDVPPEQYHEFTMGGRIEVGKHYVDESTTQSRGNYEFGFYRKTRAEIDEMVESARRRETRYYADADAYLFAAIDAFGGISSKDVVIMGSLEPWYESVCIASGASSCNTIEYNHLEYDHPLIKTYTADEYNSLTEKPRFDIALSISSFEHDGLGRYGDQIDPIGDFKAMDRMKDILKHGGVLFLAVPIGKDLLYWNAHRKYGKVRLPLLFQGWTILGQVGLTSQMLEDGRHSNHVQPVWVLKNEQPANDGISWEMLIE